PTYLACGVHVVNRIHPSHSNATEPLQRHPASSILEYSHRNTGILYCRCSQYEGKSLVIVPSYTRRYFERPIRSPTRWASGDRRARNSDSALVLSMQPLPL